MRALNHLHQKIYSRESIQKQAELWRFKSKTIAFTNGVFDILHRGHIEYLCAARDHADILVVGLNNDASVKRLGKGSNRPVNDEISRALVISALQMVDALVVFEEDTPLNLIEIIKPDILVKGGDYNPEVSDKSDKQYIVGSDFVKNSGGRVIAIPLTEGFSTTGIIARMNEGNGKG